MRHSRVACLAVLAFSCARADAQSASIEHQPVACAVADRFPRLLARLAPADTIATARVVFQGESAREWYSVAMRTEGPDFVGVLPKPMKSLKAFRYYIEATDKALGTNRTPDYTATVVGDAGACKGKLLAGALASASVLLQGSAGAAALPAGFSAAGVVVASASTAGSVAGAAGAATGGGGGLSTGAIAGIVGGVGAAAAGVAVAAGKGGDDDASQITYRVAFESNSNQTGIGLVECGGSPGLFFSFQFVNANANGSFDSLWGNPTPLVRAVGQVTATTFQATLACVNGARSGSLSATGSNSAYTGTFEFGNSRGSVSVTKER